MDTPALNLIKLHLNECLNSGTVQKHCFQVSCETLTEDKGTLTTLGHTPLCMVRWGFTEETEAEQEPKEQDCEHKQAKGASSEGRLPLP